MNPENLVQSLQTGLRVTVGAATSLVEGIQDPVKREEAMATFQLDWDSMTEKLAEKGEVAEREAREFVEQNLSAPTAAPDTPASSPSRPQPSSQASADLRELTDELTALREELEQLRSQKQ